MLRIRVGHDERSAFWLTFPQQPGKIDLLTAVSYTHLTLPTTSRG